MKETMRETTKNIMTEKTKNRLERDLTKAHQKQTESGKRIGEAAGQDCDWHDNAAYDEAIRDYQLSLDRTFNLQAKLRGVEIIKPREEIETVGIGNTVVIKIEDEEEQFTILGNEDSGTNPDWISFKTPLADSILGKRKGEKGFFKVDHDKQEVEIIDILPGDF